MSRFTRRAITLQTRPTRRGVAVSARLNQYLTIPAFSIAYPMWAGSSYALGTMALSLPANFAFRLPATQLSTTFVLAVKWTTSGVVSRYKLWQGVGENFDYPLYAGEVIPATGAVLEIWNVKGSLTAVLGSARNLLLDLLEDPTSCCDVEATGYGTAVTNPYGEDELAGILGA
jgi:hypothetical protein